MGLDPGSNPSDYLLSMLYSLFGPVRIGFASRKRSISVPSTVARGAEIDVYVCTELFWRQAPNRAGGYPAGIPEIARSL